MSCLIDVAVPELAVGTLTYESNVEIKTGARVIVSVNKSRYAGFVIGASTRKLPEKIEIKPLEGIIDDEFISDSDIWDVAKWTAHVCLCEISAVLKAIFPKEVITGEKVSPPPKLNESKSKFKEINFFNPFYKERVNFYIEELKQNKRTLILFPRKSDSKKFYEILPEDIKNETLIWPSTGGKKLFEAWKSVNEKKFRVVAGHQISVFAPLKPEKIIVEDEADFSYVFQHSPKISARSLAGRRALFSGSEFILSGSIPSLKTFMRSKPDEKIFPDKKNIILVDIFRSKKAEEKGVKGYIPLTFSLLKRTKRELIQNNNVIWILDRLGRSSEVMCENCGEIIKCEKCGNVMRSEGGGNILYCRFCGAVKSLPEKCGKCGYELLIGNRPGLESLYETAERFYKNFNVHLYSEKSLKSQIHGLILSTRGGLELLTDKKLKPSLIAFIDLDFEMSGYDYNSRFNAFNMLWKSYWKGREIDSDRKILIQSRSSGMNLAGNFYRGWKDFFNYELKQRKEFSFPPYGLIIEIECSKENIREKLTQTFSELYPEIFVMDPGDLKLPLSINISSLEIISKILDERLYNFKKDLKITVRSE